MNELLNAVKQALIRFIEEIKMENWFGKEREIISRFAFTNLLEQTVTIIQPSQIGIEVRVRQITGKGKKEVCKDLVIWKFPFQTVWSKQSSVPMMIIEWKHNQGTPNQIDIEWLKQYTFMNSDCIGVAVNVDTNPEYRLVASLINNGVVKEEKWIDFPRSFT